jgi:hypothetical protein
MILDEYVEIELTNRNYKKLVKKYDTQLFVGDILRVPINELSIGSHNKVNISCDYCGKKLIVPFKRYINSTKVVDKYSCSSKECSNKKIIEVNNVKYGVDNVFQNEFLKYKIKKKLNEKYGVNHPMHSDKVKDKIKETNLKKYGVDNYSKTDEYKTRVKETNMKKYGVEWYLQSIDLREKSKKTSIKKYGVDHPHKSREVREKFENTCFENYGLKTNLLSECNIEQVKKTNLEKYGFEYPSQSEEVKEKMKSTNLDRYGVDNYTKTDEYKEKSKLTNLEKYGNEYVLASDIFRNNMIISNDNNYIEYKGNSISLFKCDEGHNFEIGTSLYFSRKRINTPLCTICYPINNAQSIKELLVYNYIRSIYDGEIIQSYRDGLEIDIYLPDLNLGFEFNGLYWHSSDKKSKNYHIDKTQHFNNKGIRIIHIWEDDWKNKEEILKSMINNHLGKTSNKIYARKCRLSKIDDMKIVRDFLNENHIQGFVSSKIKIGLYHNNELVSIMTFDKNEGRKKMNDKEWNLSRFCNKINTSVVGGASKLLSYFINEYYPKRIISYADIDWSIGDLYLKLGFKEIYKTQPDYKYILDDVRIHKSRFRKSRTGITESDLNILKVYDCGKSKFEIKLS